MRQILGREAAFKALSAFIVVILGTQLVVGLIDPGRWGWPMVAYPMFKTAHYDGDRFDDFRVYAVLTDDTKLQIEPGDVGMSYWIFRQNMVGGLLNDRIEKLAPIIERYCDQSQGAMARLEVSDIGVAISAHGPIAGLEPRVLAAMAVACE